MALTPVQVFKVGFLMKCAEDGLTIEETKQRVKQALQLAREKRAWPGEKLFGSALNLGGKLVGTAAPYAAGLAIGAPIVAGGLAGYGIAKAQGGGDSVQEAKQDEVVGEYERLADEARRRARLKKLQNATGRRVIALTPGEQ